MVVWNLVSHIKGRNKTDDVWEQGPKDNIFKQEGLFNIRTEEVAQWGAS
jgi:hypothetical protein